MQPEVIHPAYERLFTRFATWAEAQPDVRLILVLGSRARSDQPADEYSDADILFLVDDPRRFVEHDDWLEPLGTMWLSFLEPTATGDGIERRILFAGGLDVDFIPVPVAAVRAWTRVPADVADIVRRGVRVLLDKDGLLAQLTAAPADAPARVEPTEREYSQVVNDFLYHVVWTAKKLARGELWTAKSCLDDYMKWRLLQMIEWHARLTRGVNDTWHGGRFLEKWADPRALEGLRRAFARYDAAEVKDALRATLELFHWLAVETGGTMAYVYPLQVEEHITKLIDKIL